MYTLCQYGPANLNRRITAPLPPCQCWKSHQLSRFWRQSNLTWRLMGWDFFSGTFAGRGSSTCLLTFLCSISFVITNILNHETHPPPPFQCWIRSRNFALKSVFVDFFTRMTLLRTTFNIEKEGGGAAEMLHSEGWNLCRKFLTNRTAIKISTQKAKTALHVFQKYPQGMREK